MKVTKQQLALAQHAGLTRNAEELYEFLISSAAGEQGRFNLINLLYGLGTLIAVSGASILAVSAWSELGGLGIMLTALSLQIMITLIAEKWLKSGKAVAAALSTMITITLTPLTLYGLLEYLGYWPQGTQYTDYHHLIKKHWLVLELGTIFVSLVALWRYRFPVLLVPAAATFWYLGMDIVPAISDFLNKNNYDNFSLFATRSIISAIYGSVLFVLAYVIQKYDERHKSYATWLFLPAVLSLLGGLSCWAYDQNSELFRLVLFVFECVLIFVGLKLKQPLISILSTLAAWGYLAYLAHDVFESMISYNLFLIASGLSMIWLATGIYKNRGLKVEDKTEPSSA